MEQLIVSVSGVRGIVGETLTPRVACDFGCAFAAFLAGKGGAGRRKVVIGRDTRPSGPMIRNAVVAGLLAGGVDVVDLGVVTTPGVALMTRRLQADGGVMITASHNPSPYNGIKFLQPSGPGLRAADAVKLKALWSSGDFPLADTGAVGGESFDPGTHAAHVAAVCAIVGPKAISQKGFKVVLDSINGAGCIVTPLLLEALGCRVFHINNQPDGQFAHTPEPIAENLRDLCKVTAERQADVGFAQDPDADRLVLVNENGDFVGEEYTLALATAYVLRHRKGKVATNLVTSRMVADVAAAAGCEVVLAPTGEANVVEAMERAGCIFGGEGNGGVIDPRVVPVRDSLVGMAMVLQYMAETGKPLSQLVAEIPRYTMVKTKFPCPSGAAAKVAAATREAFASRPGAAFNESDGLRIDLPEGWVCVRGSNTEPIMRISAEAREAAAANKLVAEVRSVADAVLAS